MTTAQQRILSDLDRNRRRFTLDWADPVQVAIRERNLELRDEWEAEVRRIADEERGTP